MNLLEKLKERTFMMEQAAGGQDDRTLYADVRANLQRRFQHYLDKTTIYVPQRWIGFVALIGLYSWRAWYLRGWYIVNYGLGIFMLNLFIGFLSPAVDPDADGPSLPTSNSEEFRPFSRKIPEFQFWWSLIKAILLAWTMTFFPFFNIPVFWPVLVLYFIALMGLTLKDRIAHMIKHRYIPCSWGKRKYGGKGGKAKGGSPAGGATTGAETLFKGSSSSVSYPR